MEYGRHPGSVMMVILLLYFDLIMYPPPLDRVRQGGGRFRMGLMVLMTIVRGGFPKWSRSKGRQWLTNGRKQSTETEKSGCRSAISHPYLLAPLLRIPSDTETKGKNGSTHKLLGPSLHRACPVMCLFSAAGAALVHPRST